SAATLEIDEVSAFLEGWRTHDDVALGIHHERVAVEHQLVLSADHVDVRDGQSNVEHARTDHRLALALLVALVRGSVDDDEQLRPIGSRELGGLRLPDVLADEQAHPKALAVHHRRLSASVEVALLVE